MGDAEELPCRILLLRLCAVEIVCHLLNGEPCVPRHLILTEVAKLSNRLRVNLAFSCLALSIAATGSPKEGEFTDHRYIQPARFPAGSIPDPTVPRGYGRSTNFPVLVNDRDLLDGSFRNILKSETGGVQIQLLNGSKEDVWLKAADGTLQAILQAKDKKGRWRAIQFLWSRNCGNSYHSVLLPPGKQWSYSVPLPKGTLQTSVRFEVRIGSRRIHSNEVRMSIPPERFTLSPSDAKANCVFQVGTGAVGHPFAMTTAQKKAYMEHYSKFGRKST